MCMGGLKRRTTGPLGTRCSRCQAGQNSGCSRVEIEHARHVRCARERPLLGGAAARRSQRSAVIAAATALLVAAGIFVLSARIDGAQPAPPSRRARPRRARRSRAPWRRTSTASRRVDAAALRRGLRRRASPGERARAEGVARARRRLESVRARAAPTRPPRTTTTSQRARTALLHAASRSAQARVTCARTGPLELELSTAGATASATTVSTTTTMYGACRYVRREIRTLSDADRATFIAALRLVHNATDGEAAKYGARFTSAKTPPRSTTPTRTASTLAASSDVVPAFQLTLERAPRRSTRALPCRTGTGSPTRPRTAAMSGGARSSATSGSET